MSYIFGTNVDFNYNETLKQRLENLISFPTLTTAEKGYTFFHTANNKFYGWTGAAWIDFSTGGGGGGGDVFLAANQTFTGFNIFNTGIEVDSTIAFVKRAGNIVSSVRGLLYFKTDNSFNISVGTGTSFHNATFAGIDAFTVARTFTFPDKSGTVAMAPTISSASETLTVNSNPNTYTAIPSTVTIEQTEFENFIHIFLTFTVGTPALVAGNNYSLDVSFNSLFNSSVELEQPLAGAYGNFNVKAQNVTAFTSNTTGIRIVHQIINAETRAADTTTIRVAGIVRKQ
jgi:hypothetical protein